MQLLYLVNYKISYKFILFFLQIMDGHKKCLPYVVESYCTVETAAFTFLCDGFYDNEDVGMSKHQFRLHRKLAPFKISFVSSPTSKL